MKLNNISWLCVTVNPVGLMRIILSACCIIFYCFVNFSPLYVYVCLCVFNSVKHNRCLLTVCFTGNDHCILSSSLTMGASLNPYHRSCAISTETVLCLVAFCPLLINLCVFLLGSHLKLDFLLLWPDSVTLWQVHLLAILLLLLFNAVPS